MYFTCVCVLYLYQIMKIQSTKKEKERNVGRVKGCLGQSGIDAPAKSVSPQSVACPVTHTHTLCSQIQIWREKSYTHIPCSQIWRKNTNTQIWIGKIIHTNANTQIQKRKYKEKKLYKCKYNRGKGFWALVLVIKGTKVDSHQSHQGHHTYKISAAYRLGPSIG